MTTRTRTHNEGTAHGTKLNLNLRGIGIGGLLLVLFVGLKLGKVIDWSWWWVLSPLWIPVILFIVVAGVFVVVYAIGQYYWYK
jgi:hypothetical protein